ncbi:MAG: alpha/beta hydrolase [Alphaproteobacteria bacterium]|nr:alpha/beta hydrolase [Alphaproteobacteria bacterium]
MTMRRGFVDIDETQIHYRISRPAKPTGKRPLVLFHGSPASSITILPVIDRFAKTRTVIAPDTIGQGQSGAPAKDDLSMTEVAEYAWRAIDPLTKDLGPVDLYGYHTGAAIAAEIAIAHPDRVKKVILDGVKAEPVAWAKDYVASLDKRKSIDQEGTQFFKAFNDQRNVFLFWPPHQKSAANARRTGLPSADYLHDAVVDGLAGLRTSHIAYKAAFSYAADKRLPLLKAPTLLTASKLDMLYAEMPYASKLIPHAAVKPHPHETLATTGTKEEVDDLVKMMSDWLDS